MWTDYKAKCSGTLVDKILGGGGAAFHRMKLTEIHNQIIIRLH